MILGFVVLWEAESRTISVGFRAPLVLCSSPKAGSPVLLPVRASIPIPPRVPETPLAKLQHTELQKSLVRWRNCRSRRSPYSNQSIY